MAVACYNSGNGVAQISTLRFKNLNAPSKVGVGEGLQRCRLQAKDVRKAEDRAKVPVTAFKCHFTIIDQL